MKIEIRRTMDYIDVQVSDGNTTIDLGLMNKEERIEFLKTLQETVISELDHNDRDWWIESIRDEVAYTDYNLEIVE